MPSLLTLFSGIRGKLLGLLLLSLALSFALVATAVGIFFTNYHSDAMRERFRDAAARLSADEQERLNGYWRDVRAIGADPGIIASLNLISQYGYGAEKDVAFESERQKLAMELRRLSRQPVDSRLALLDARGTLLSVLSIASNGVVEEAYAISVNGETRLRVRRFGKTEEWRDEAVPRVLLTLPPVGETVSDNIWYRGQGGLSLALGVPVNKSGADAELQRVGRVVLVHEYTREFGEAVARQTGFEFRIHLGRTGMPFGLDGDKDGVLNVPPLLGERQSGQMGWRETRDYFVGVRHIALHDGDYAYALFASGKEAVRSQLVGTLATILAALLVAMLAALVLGQWLAKRWISRPAQELIKVIDTAGRGDYKALRALAPGPDEFGIMSHALVEMADTIEQREQENARARAELRQSEERLRQVMAVTGDGIWDWHVPKDTVTHNEQWCRLLGLDDDYLEHPVEKFVQLIHPDDRATVSARVHDCLQGQSVYRSEHRMLRADGSFIWVVDRGDVTERDETGRPLRMVGSMTDVTLRRQAQDDLQRMNAELEDRVQERTSELVAAKEAAEAATQVKSEFLANMSHEIRTPINAVLGMLYLTLRGELPGSQRNHLVKAQAAAHSLLGIINEILDLSKIEAGKLKLERIEFGFDGTIERVTDVIGAQAEEKGLQFLIRYDRATPGVVVGDPLRIGQVLLNLCGNAVKFTEQGQVELSIKVLESNTETVVLRVCVKDSGIGMNAEQQDHLFQKFSQADQSTTRRFGGTGLGLAISKSLVEMMGGRIWLEFSKPGQGTEICFTLPLGIASGVDAGRQGKQSGALLKGVHALVVDDNEAALGILSDMLRSFGMEVDTQSDIAAAQAAVDMAMDSHPYQLVLMDWRMPGRSGAPAVRMLCGAGAAPPKVIVVTAYGHEEVQREAEQAGAVGCLHKPVSPSVLLDAVLNAFGLEANAGNATSKVGIAQPFPRRHVLAGTRLLLVEDNDINREFARELLTGEDIEVDEAVNGMDALQKVQEREYDFVLMDVHMPVMDGLEAARQIRALSLMLNGERYGRLPIIAMTALAMSQDVEKSLEAGMNEHITKPIDPELLLSVLSKLAPGRRHHVPTQASGSNAIPAELLAMTSLDVRGGILRIGNKVQAYRRQLLRFGEHYAHAMDEITRLLAEQGTMQAEAYCHALKGVVGNIGATQLHEVISRIDNELKEDRIPAPEVMEEATRRLRAVIEDIAGLDQPGNVASGSGQQ